MEVTADSSGAPNALYASGGFPLFLTRVVDEGTVEFGGSILGPTPAKAPDAAG